MTDPVLTNGQYDLDGFVFGNRTPWQARESSKLVNSFDVSQDEPRVEKSYYPREDGQRWGKTYRGGQVITFDVTILTGSRSAYPELSDMLQAWRSDSVRRRAGSVSTLRIAKNDHVRRVYGRAGLCKPVYGSVERGMVKLTATFECEDDLYYDDVESNNTVSIVPSATGGYTYPVTYPLSMSQIAEAQGYVNVEGSAATPVIFIVYGPISQPRIEVTGKYTIGLDYTLNSQQYIAIDSRKHRRTVLLNNVQNLPGVLTQSSPAMEELTLSPGSYNVVLRGTDSTGTASLTYAWRNAHVTPG